jgi:hypothetical protein
MDESTRVRGTTLHTGLAADVAIRNLAATTEMLLNVVGDHIAYQRAACGPVSSLPAVGGSVVLKDADEQQRLQEAQPERWLAMARTDFQTGLMKLTRAVAQPTGL